MSNSLLHLAHSSTEISIDDAAALYNDLTPVAPEFVLGDWKGTILRTGHPDVEKLKAMGWAGKRFNSINDVNPVVIQSSDGVRTCITDWGHARVREVRFRGVVSAAMIYDQLPIIDHFRLLNENAVAGVMDNKDDKNNFGLYFILERVCQRS
ncbi:uncharacterized protein N7511_006883 [Penicillium nucicola]|uniref:uncharacterized protein n=1 Tax=Penicillium nucicola TaxID=1850975 RepID=UPI0025459F31|nr:uncharacterized protein N7511_006883 [Penicillium nucicola]KAJ5758189.1 hypothetical protein N7511_006883 [Penicillium nucicola]